MRSKAWMRVMTFSLVGLCLVSPLRAEDTHPVLKVVQDSLEKRGNFYFVKGSIYNPSEKGASNVTVTYHIWKKWIGKDGHGQRIKDTGGLVEAHIKYLPPKQTVEYSATGDDNAPVMVHDVPDSLEAEITCEWEH